MSLFLMFKKGDTAFMYRAVLLMVRFCKGTYFFLIARIIFVGCSLSLLFVIGKAVCVCYRLKDSVRTVILSLPFRIAIYQLCSWDIVHVVEKVSVGRLFFVTGLKRPLR